MEYKIGAIANMKRESDILISKFSNQLKNDATIADVRNSIISDMKKYQNTAAIANTKLTDEMQTQLKNALHDIAQVNDQVANANKLLNVNNENTLESLKDITTIKLIDVESYKITGVQEHQDIRHGTITDIAEFQNNLTISQLMQRNN